jgi:hypothetical protein
MARTLVLDRLQLNKVSLVFDLPAPGAASGAPVEPRVFAEYALFAGQRRVQLEHLDLGQQLSPARKAQIARLVADLTADLSAIEQV